MAKTSFYQSDAPPADATRNSLTSFYRDEADPDNITSTLSPDGLPYAPDNIITTIGVRAYDVGIYVGGPTFISNEVLFAHSVDVAVIFPANFASSVAKALTAPTGSPVFSLQKNGVEFGTLTYSGGTGTFVSPETSFVPGDVLTLVAPTSPDATIAHLAITLFAQRN